MDVLNMLISLREDKVLLDQAIRSLERLVDQVGSKKRGRPVGSRNKAGPVEASQASQSKEPGRPPYGRKKDSSARQEDAA